MAKTGSIRELAALTAACLGVTGVLAIASCGSGSGQAGPPPGGQGAADGGTGGLDASADSGLDAATTDSGLDALDTDSEDEAHQTPQTYVRIANWAPDAPASGYDVCLAPQGTTIWMGPLLAQDLDAGTLGQGGANGAQFPWVTRYLAVPPGQYDVQLVLAGASCATGVIAPTYGLPILSQGAHTTLAVVGDVRPTGNDAALKMEAFADETSTASGGAALRVIDVIPSLGYVDVGTGTLSNGNFAPLFVDVPFGAPGSVQADGGATDPNGYLTIEPLSNVELSAHATGGTIDRATASHVSLPGGSVTTMALVNGANGGRPPQFLVCTDSGPASGAQSPCNVIPQ